MGSSLINDDDLVWAFTLMPMTGTPLTRAKSLIAKVGIEVGTGKSSWAA
jgi:hypothetical protein